MDSVANTSWAEYTSSPKGMGPVPYISTAAFAIFIFLYLLHRPSDSKPPLINHRDTFDLGSSKLRRDFVVGGWQMMQNALKTYSEKPFRVFSDFGEVTILPTRYANEIRNAENLSFSKWTYNTFHADLPGFEGFREGSSDSRIIQEVIKTKLTQSLAKATLPLSEESDLSLQEIFTDSKEWHDLPLRKAILQLVARLSSRVFLGEELCRDPAWLQVTIAYTIDAFAAATELRIWPRPLRLIVHWFLPSCRKLRAQVKEARSILTPVLEKRRQMKAARNGDFVVPNDAIEWFEEKARKDGVKYDPAIAQLLLSVAAIHTTSDLITQAMFDLTQNPNMIEPLRKEMIDVLGQDGWQKTSLYKLKLLDSVLKETQRLKPIAMISMRRVVMSPTTLSDGLKLAPNSTIAISTHRLRDPEVHENPEEFDGYRWYRMREIPGKENVAQLASTSANHLAFGHGKHACPGRFFAANEAKIALAHLLLKYDWKLADGVKPQVAKTAFSLNADPFAKVSIRRRQEEIIL